VAGFAIRDAPLEGPGGAPGVAVSGELDIATAPALEAALEDAIRDSAGALVLDVTELEFVDSSGLSVLLRTRALLGREDRALVLVCPEGAVLRVLEVAGVTDLFSPYRTREAAAAALVPIDRPTATD
jgi:anti-sigma B factor antagonist